MRALHAICRVALAIVFCGCSATAASPLPATSQPSTQPAVNGIGFSANCPPDWKLISKGGDYAMDAVPAATSGDVNDPAVSTIAIEVPVLPMHIPGFIPLGGVASGYVSDLKKKYPDLTVDDRSNVKLDGANARRIVSSFQNHGKPWRDLAVVAVHGDHVYVITADCDASTLDSTQTAFDALVASVKWTRKS
jgi:hypothetical protein